MVNIFMRALRRTGTRLQFSQGFHPKPKMVFDDALPIGLESLCERLVLSVPKNLSPEDLVADLNRQLPAGLSVTACEPYRKPDCALKQAVVYRVAWRQGRFDLQALRQFEAAPALFHERRNRKGQLKKIDLKAMVLDMRRLDPDSLEIVIRHRPDALLRPDIVLREVFHMTDADIRRARIVKLRYQPCVPAPPDD
jgi:radical SAM-linked protein